MSFWNPWGEARRLRRLLETQSVEADMQGRQYAIIQDLRAEVWRLRDELTHALDAAEKLKGTTHRRDPKTGRILPRGQ
jgi:hypothetical protein